MLGGKGLAGTHPSLIGLARDYRHRLLVSERIHFSMSVFLRTAEFDAVLKALRATLETER